MTNREALMRHLERMDDESFAEGLSEICGVMKCSHCIFAYVTCPGNSDPNRIYDWLSQESLEDD